MSDTGFSECSAYLDQLYSIDSSDLNAEGIAEKKINAKCIGDIDIYNDVYNEVMLYFTQESVEIIGTIRLENKGKLTLNLGDYKLFGTGSKNLEKNNLVQNRKDGIGLAYIAVNKYLEENPIIRPAALPLVVMGIGQAMRACAMNSACVKTVMEISIGAAALFGMKFTADKLNDESYKSIKNDDSNDQNKQNIK
jgi:hypothetical protein